jgi:hypothetical protein
MKSLFNYVKLCHYVSDKGNQQEHGDSDALLMEMGAWVQMVPVDSISKEVPNHILYTLADNGMIRFDDAKESHMIGFASHRVYLEILQESDTTQDLPYHDCVLLKLAQPDGESVAMRFLAAVFLYHWPYLNKQVSFFCFAVGVPKMMEYFVRCSEFEWFSSGSIFWRRSNSLVRLIPKFHQ